MTEFVSISCDECRLQSTPACDDCVVSFLLGADEHLTGAVVEPGRQPERTVQPAVIVDAAEARAVRMLQDAGLVPRLRFERRVC